MVSKTKLTHPQVKRLCQIAETGETRGPQQPVRKLIELGLIEPRKYPADYCGIILYQLTEAGRATSR